MAGYWKEVGGDDTIQESGTPKQPFRTVKQANGDETVYEYHESKETPGQTTDTQPSQQTQEQKAKGYSVIASIGGALKSAFLKTDEEMKNEERKTTSSKTSSTKSELRAKQRKAVAGFGRRGLEVFGGMNFDEKGKLKEDSGRRRVFGSDSSFDERTRQFRGVNETRSRYESPRDDMLNKFNLPRTPVRDFMDNRQAGEMGREDRGTPTLEGFNQRSQALNCYRDKCFGEAREMPTEEGFQKKMKDKKNIFGF